MVSKSFEKPYIAVIGASGFVGSWIFKMAQEKFGADNVLGVYFTKRLNGNCVDFHQFTERFLNKTQVLLIAAGNSNHNLAERDFACVYEMETKYIDDIFSKGFQGFVVYLGSAAIYYGSKAVVDEKDVYPVKNSYGLAKLLAEQTLRCGVKMSGSRVLIYRLMYAFGEGEKQTRLMTAIKNAVKTGTTLKVFGSGTSYLNPLPVWFVAQILVKSVNLIQEQTKEIEVCNLAHELPVRVIDVVEFMRKNFDLKYELWGNESYPVEFYVNVAKLKDFLSRMGERFPDVWTEMYKFVAGGSTGE